MASFSIFLHLMFLITFQFKWNMLFMSSSNIASSISYFLAMSNLCWAEIDRRNVYGGSKWISWICGRNALRSDSCPIHIDKQRNGCYGEKLTMIFNVIVSCFHIYIYICIKYHNNIFETFTARQVQELWFWKMP